MSVPLALALRSTIGGRDPGFSAAHARVCSSLLEYPRSALNSLLADYTHGKLQPMRRLYACSFSSGACDTKSIVTSRAFRCGTRPLMLSAIDELTGQPA
jgi:hypothetical protein